MILPNKHYKQGYMPFEEVSLMILEQYGIGFYKQRKEVEIATQALKKIFESKKDNTFDINLVSGCNIPWSENVFFEIHFDFMNTFGEYVPKYLLDTDENRNPIIPPPDKDDNYDFDNEKIRQSYILIHFDPNWAEFPVFEDENVVVFGVKCSKQLI